MSRMYIYPEQYGGYDNRRGRGSRMEYGEDRSSMVHPNYETLPRARRGRDSRGRYTSAYNEYDTYDRMDNRGYDDYPAMEGDRRVIGFTGAMGGMRQMQRGMEMGGHSWEEDSEDLTMDDAREWVRSMHADKGKKKGEHWTFDQTTNLLRQRGYRHDPAEWYAIIHAVYYDYCTVAEKYGLAKNDEFYADLAHAWLDDEDAVDNKAAMYYDCIVE